MLLVRVSCVLLEPLAASAEISSCSCWQLLVGARYPYVGFVSLCDRAWSALCGTPMPLDPFNMRDGWYLQPCRSLSEDEILHLLSASEGDVLEDDTLAHGSARTDGKVSVEFLKACACRQHLRAAWP